MPIIRMTWRLCNKTFVKQFTIFSNMNSTSFLKSVLKEFRHVSWQKADIFNIFYDGE
jgi:hypothetical protein